MLTTAAFDDAIQGTSDPAKRIAIFGALLAKASGLGPKLTIAGGSAITLDSRSRFVSEDIDIVGERRRIVPVLRKRNFAPVKDTDGQVYWRRDDLGLFVDILHRFIRSGSGWLGRTRTLVTEKGPIRVSAIEDLIVRRSVF